MAKYRKKPVVIEAVLFDGTLDSVGSFFRPNDQWGYEVNPDRLHIATLEGVMIASRGDYIIRGVAGEVYPCKPDIFAQTYEPLAEIPLTGRHLQDATDRLREVACDE